MCMYVLPASIFKYLVPRHIYEEGQHHLEQEINTDITNNLVARNSALVF